MVQYRQPDGARVNSIVCVAVHAIAIRCAPKPVIENPCLKRHVEARHAVGLAG